MPSLALTALLLPYQPALYLADGVHAAAQHAADYTPVTAASPAQPGEVIILYADGLGDVYPRVDLGAAAPSDPPAMTTLRPWVTIGGVPAQLLFSGLSPGLVNLYQLNVQVPAGVPAGDQDVIVSVDGNYQFVYSSPAARLAVGSGNSAARLTSYP